MAEYDRELIACMLEVSAGHIETFNEASMQEQARLLREADNAEAAGVHTATQPPAVGVDVSEEMVDRGWIAATTACVEVIDGEHTYVAPVSPEQWDRAIRAALHVALRTGGGADHG